MEQDPTFGVHERGVNIDSIRPNAELTGEFTIEDLYRVLEEHAIDRGGPEYALGLSDTASDSYSHSEAGLDSAAEYAFNAYRERKEPGAPVANVYYHASSEYHDPVDPINVPESVVDLIQSVMEESDSVRPLEELSIELVRHTCFRLNTIKGFDMHTDVHFEIDGMMVFIGEDGQAQLGFQVSSYEGEEDNEDEGEEEVELSEEDELFNQLAKAVDGSVEQSNLHQAKRILHLLMNRGRVPVLDSPEYVSEYRGFQIPLF